MNDINSCHRRATIHAARTIGFYRRAFAAQRRRLQAPRAAGNLQHRNGSLAGRFNLAPGPTQYAPNIRRASAATQAIKETPPHAARAARVHLVIGPVGAGKSTFALRLAQDRSGIRLTLDDWMVTLFRPDRPASGVPAWYQERAERCIDQIWKLAQQLGDRGDEVVLEIGLLRRAERERFYERVREADLPLTLYVLDAPREVRRARVLERNSRQGSTFSMVVPPEIFELASDLWQAPDADECEGRDVRILCSEAS